MAIITPERLKTLAPTIRDDRATAYAPALEAALPLGDITTRLRLVHFMAQMGHESGGFRALVENLNYSAQGLLTVFRSRVQTLDKAKELVAAGKEAIANFVYGYRPSLGNVNPGDGYKYIGRGFMMITGRANYERYAAMIGQPLIEQPELLENPVYAAQAAAAFWRVNNINAKADLDDIEGVTRLVNGGTIGLADRQAWLDRAKTTFPPLPPAPAATSTDGFSQYFTLDELTHTDNRTIDNTPPSEVVAVLKQTAAQMDRVRIWLGKPIRVNSGYRSPALNKAIGGAPNSAHCLGYAVDFVSPAFGTPRDICKKIIASDIRYDQLIYEGTWVHISFDPRLRMQTLTAAFTSTGTVYSDGIT
ncbi:D-Ala-D-Ala carboxypeptidase family metallohydrolase [Asticcacaulis sp. 201]|uniref:D-Ala-D-Ala carboxypeptidase family metallohydrolase n=1 Tax=Asticcacaulis sp. 201 TaxID=3028787 RepID=UPI0029170C28|nr:D-Ala-D-Ala carboxypeptidase family metallohydrolase [Asticcacaulis sp. 201]MDV6330753.1 D-Ala-D-Ala carboxypeptidase family metallohydrolase [Asticcacaulis sp. 201]